MIPGDGAAALALAWLDVLTMAGATALTLGSRRRRGYSLLFLAATLEPTFAWALAILATRGKLPIGGLLDGLHLSWLFLAVPMLASLLNTGRPPWRTRGLDALVLTLALLAWTGGAWLALARAVRI